MARFLFLFLTGLVFILPAQAAAEDATTEGVPPPVPFQESPAPRARNGYFVLGNYSPADLLIPGKYGFTAGLVRGGPETWELEFLTGGAGLPWVLKDLGRMSDRRLSLLRRSYFAGNSFNLSYGLSHTSFSLQLGSGIMNRVSGGRYPSLDLIEVETLAANVGIGNRWVFRERITLGVDWLSWTQPLYVLRRKDDFLRKGTNREDRDEAGKATSLITYFPRFAALKVQLGILF